MTCCSSLALLQLVVLGSLVHVNDSLSVPLSAYRATTNTDTKLEPIPDALEENTASTNLSGIDKASDNSRSTTSSKSSSIYHAPIPSLPFPLLVQSSAIQKAIILAITNPSLGGVALYGSKGTGKSEICRAAYRLLEPTIDIVQGENTGNIDPHQKPDGPLVIDSILRQELEFTNKTLFDLPTKTIPCPRISVPVHCQEENLLGTLDLEKSLSTGHHVFEPGLLSRAHRGLLIGDDMHLWDDGVTAIFWKAVTSKNHNVKIEREGLSVEYPCSPQLTIVTFNPEEGDTRDDWLDHLPMILPVCRDRMSVKDRVDVVLNVEGFRDKTLDLSEALQEEECIRRQIAEAKKVLPFVSIAHDQIEYICQEATRADCQGQRGEIFATEIAKTAAALDGRSFVQAGDLELGVLLAIVPRARVIPAGDEEDAAEAKSSSRAPQPPSIPNMPQAQEPDVPPPPPPEQEKPTTEPEPQPEDNPTESEPSIPEVFLFGVETASIDPKLLTFQKWSRKGKGGKRSHIFNLQRGRFVKAIFPVGDWKQGRLAVGATLRAAAPHQRARRQLQRFKRREQQPATKVDSGKILIEKDDFRIQRLSRKSGSLIIFVVDASGSMALNRMGAAKGAAMCLLAEAYKSRDKICCIAVHDLQAEMIVPPTKSMALTRARLEVLPCGGQSPLAHGLTLALRTALNSIKVKHEVGRAIVVLISDGRPTVPLCVSEGEEFDPSIDAASKDGKPSRSFCRDEVLAIAKVIGSLKDIDLLVIDTEHKFVQTGISADIAKRAQGSYTQLSATDPSTVTQLAKQSMTRHW
eukprot:scaffold44081_cov168-Amphora_coffeaeformis.AAC.3